MSVPVALVIIGAGGVGRELVDLVDSINAVDRRFELRGFLDDGGPEKAAFLRRGVRLLGGVSELSALHVKYVIGIGSPSVRRRIDAFASSLGREAVSLVHPTAVLGGDVRLGEGTVVYSHVSVTTNVETGRHVQLHVNCAVGHDSRLGDYVTVLPGATVAGGVTLEEGVTVGANAAVVQGLRVGAMSVVGAGAAVIRDLPPGTTAVGVPARALADRRAEESVEDRQQPGARQDSWSKHR